MPRSGNFRLDDGEGPPWLLIIVGSVYVLSGVVKVVGWLCQ